MISKRTHKWRKCGLVCGPLKHTHPSLQSHLANPVAVQMDGDVYRIYYSGRDSKNRSSVGAIDFDIAKRLIVREHHDPLFEFGKAGSYYSAGVSIGCTYSVGSQEYMLFMGWQNEPGQHWRGDIGRLKIRPDFSLELECESPLLTTDQVDPISLSYPWIETMPDKTYCMWYGSTLSWDAGNGEMLHVIHGASSKDGLHWERTGLSVPYEIGSAQAFSRPTVLPHADGSYSMWFSFRGGPQSRYRIGYAESDDGKAWILANSKAGIDVSNAGWDNEMIEYPFVFRHKDNVFMLYNGNDYGRSGIGLAILDTTA